MVWRYDKTHFSSSDLWELQVASYFSLTLLTGYCRAAGAGAVIHILFFTARISFLFQEGERGK